MYYLVHAQAYRNGLHEKFPTMATTTHFNSFNSFSSSSSFKKLPQGAGYGDGSLAAFSQPFAADSASMEVNKASLLSAASL
jgi:hypothetical protein